MFLNKSKHNLSSLTFTEADLASGTGTDCKPQGLGVAASGPKDSPFLHTQVVKLCRDCLKKQEPVLGDTNIYLLRILSIASEVLSYLQMFEEAADYAKRMVDGYLWVCALLWQFSVLVPC